MNPCCPRCEESQGFRDCGDCSCHSTPSPIGWEEEFEKKFATDEDGIVITMGNISCSPKSLKFFIRQTLAQEREKMVKMLEGMKVPELNKHWANRVKNDVLEDAITRIQEGI